MKDEGSIFPMQTHQSYKMFSNENNPRSQTFLIRKLWISPQNWWCLEKKKPNKFKENKCFSDAQKNTYIKLMEIMKTTQDLKNAFNREIGIFKRAQAEMRAEF